MARLAENIRTKYSAELELNRDRVEARQQGENVFNVLTNAGNILSGGL
jgi:hypothetical protein